MVQAVVLVSTITNLLKNQDAESYQARIHFSCFKKDCQSFPNYAPHIKIEVY